jgi:hypothetical protein
MLSVRFAQLGSFWVRFGFVWVRFEFVSTTMCIVFNRSVDSLRIFEFFLSVVGLLPPIKRRRKGAHFFRVAVGYGVEVSKEHDYIGH